MKLVIQQQALPRPGGELTPRPGAELKPAQVQPKLSAAGPDRPVYSPHMATALATRAKIAAAKRGDKNPQWKGDAASDNTKRARARRLYPALGQCERCPAPAVDRHHVDGNPGNNAATNVAKLCRRCHMEADDRLANLELVRLTRFDPTDKPCDPNLTPAEQDALWVLVWAYGDERRVAGAASKRQWRATHRERDHATARRYRLTHKAEVAARNRAYRAAHRAQVSHE